MANLWLGRGPPVSAPVLVLLPALVLRLDTLMMVGFATSSQLYDIGVQECRTTKSQRKCIHLLFLTSRLVSDSLTLAREKKQINGGRGVKLGHILRCLESQVIKVPWS